jgi:hypothetical protein
MGTESGTYDMKRHCTVLVLGGIGVFALAAGCGILGPDACTLEAVFGVNISLTDEAGEPVAGATLMLRDGGYQETMTELSPGDYAGAVERAGTYSVTIEAQGLATVTLQDLRVLAGECHVTPVARDVVLPPPGTGITGVMLAGPQCPVIGPDTGSECDDRPYQGTVVVETEDGATEVTRFTGEADGTFEVPLASGTYRLVPLPGPSGFPFADEQRVDVVSGEFTQIQILFDTGIR